MSASISRKSIFQWPSRILGPPPGLLEINLACWGLFAGFVIIPLIVNFWIKWRAGAGWSFLLPCDFVYFYGIGHIAREYPLAKLYDYPLVLKVTDQIYPLNDLVWGPNPYPPYVGLLFSMFARFSFLPAYLLWIITSLGLYTVGITLTLKGVFPKEPLKRSLIVCYALGFYPFFICTLKNGQLSTLAFFAIGLAIFLESNGNPFFGGLALSLMAYKPTLFFLVGPMLLLTRRFKMLGGFVTGLAILVLITTGFGGIDIWPTYLHSLSFFRHFIESQGQSVLQLWEYVDFNSFSYSIPGGRSTAVLAILICISCASAVALTVSLWKSANRGRATQDLVWAATLTWTLLLNLYVPVWDSILVILAMILTLRALKQLGWYGYSEWIIVLGLLMLAVTWNVIAKSNRHGSQFMMLLLFALGVLQIFCLYALTHRKLIQDQELEVAAPTVAP